MKDLVRTKVNNFNIIDSITLQELEKYKLNIQNKIISIEKIFENKEKIVIEPKKIELFLNGVNLTYNLEDNVYRIYNNNSFLGLGIVKNKVLKRDIIIN